MRKILVTFAVVALLPLNASALTTPELQARIATLLTKIAELQLQLQSLQPSGGTNTTNTAATSNTSSGTSTGPTVLVCPVLSRSLSLGARGEDVAQLQSYLQADGYLKSAFESGVFDRATEAAIREWQFSHGVVTTGTADTTGFGVVGPRSRALIALDCRLLQSSKPNVSGATQTGSVISCPIAPPPTQSCATGWQAVTDKYGCTQSYKCVAPLNVSCQQHEQPVCAVGYTLVSRGNDSNGCHLGYQCISTNTASSCLSQVNEANVSCSGGIYGQGGPQLRCPVDSSYTLISLNTCTTNYLQGRGWTSVSNPAISASVTASPTSVSAGNSVNVTWAFGNAPAGSKVRLEVYKTGISMVEGNNDNGLASNASELATSGTYQWTVPGTNPCLADGGWASCLQAGSYRIVAKLYAGSSCWGFCTPGTPRTLYASVESGTLTINAAAQIPQSVENKYSELQPVYNNSLGVFLERCTAGSEVKYIVTGSGGFSGQRFYYDSFGSYQGTTSFSDTPPYTSGTMPFDRSYYFCTTIRQSK